MIEVSKLLIPSCQHATETGHLSLGSGDSEQINNVFTFIAEEM